MIWVLFALAAGLTYCVQSEINKHYKTDGFELNTFRAGIATILFLPALPLMEWPRIPEYYLVLLLEAAVSVVCMMAQYNLAAKKNGRIACLHQPIVILITFALWLALSPEQRQFFLDNPQNALYVGIGFTLFIFSLFAVRKNDAGWLALMAVIPIAVLYSVMAVISKIALEHGENMLGISLNFVFLCNLLMLIMSLPLYLSRQKGRLHPPLSTVKSSSGVAVFHSLSWLFYCLAVIGTPNPAYVGVITGLAPLWFLIYYKIRKHEDDASPMAGLVMGVAAIIVLIGANT